MQPGVRMLLSVRQLLNETDDDVATVSLLTSLILPVAESLQRMRRAAERALAAYAEEERPRDPITDSQRERRVVAVSDDVRHRAVVPYNRGVGLETHLYDNDDYRLTLVALESCDAAYRQIQVRKFAMRHHAILYSLTCEELLFTMKWQQKV